SSSSAYSTKIHDEKESCPRNHVQRLSLFYGCLRRLCWSPCSSARRHRGNSPPDIWRSLRHCWQSPLPEHRTFCASPSSAKNPSAVSMPCSTTSATTTCSNSNAACPTSVTTKRRSPIISATMANSSAAGNARRGGSEKLLISVGLALCKGTACRAPVRLPYIPKSTREISKASTGCPV